MNDKIDQFIRHEWYSRSYKKYAVRQYEDKYAIYVKPSWRKGYIFDSSTEGKYHDTKDEALDVLKRLADKFSKEYWVTTYFYAKRRSLDG